MSTALNRLRPGRWVLPTTVVAVYLYILAPVLFVAWIAFFDQDIIVFPPEGYTLRWFTQVWERRSYQQGFVTSFHVATVAMVFGVAFGTLASIALVRYRFPGREAINTLLLSPLIVPGIVAADAGLLAIRPEKVALGSAAMGLENRVQGTVDLVTYLGSFTEYRVRLSPTETIMISRPNGDGTQPAAAHGHPVVLGWRAEAGLLLPEPGAR